MKKKKLGKDISIKHKKNAPSTRYKISEHHRKHKQGKKILPFNSIIESINKKDEKHITYIIFFVIGILIATLSSFKEIWLGTVIGILIIILSLVEHRYYHYKGYKKVKPIKHEKPREVKSTLKIVTTKKQKRNYLPILFIILGLAIITLSYLNKFWVGLGIGLIIIILFLIKSIPLPKMRKKPKHETKPKKVEYILKKVTEKKEKKNPIYIVFTIIGISLIVYSIIIKQYIYTIVGLYFLYFTLLIHKIKVIKPQKLKQIATVSSPDLIKKSKYETDFDILYNLVEKSGYLPIDIAAKKFNVSKEKIEEWAQVLEEHGLIKIKYPALGSPILIKWKK